VYGVTLTFVTSSSHVRPGDVGPRWVPKKREWPKIAPFVR
jgi:hypothetical protein